MTVRRSYALALVAAFALAASASAQKREHYRVRWTLYQSEHRISTGLGVRVRALRRQLRDLRVARHVQAVAVDWRAKQIAAAETIAHEAGTDPWPNCPDPIWDGAASWDVTVACENSGSWLDSPGYYRCGLQFDPMWETRFGRLCP